ncbi:glutathione S-transferase family protein [Thalassotalea sp. 1_MG-2023]|uniref:glutathione S-transferase family protein n=1 Tax=Thalassotalea sp. 1_MG-2023 TaxID=3062680 RepID=UPI0026E307FB|nr:glutathione S-transferase family protein [Thalassotalea sp. 1_MG-2023]MDO6428185.1 glutathione S-transferase family protein [Thalassotalea sp. 1_MG-2023]
MKLLGSTTSPFVRRLRVYLTDKEYEFINLDIFAEQDRALLTTNNPTKKIPALIDGELCIYDSRVIYRYLANKFSEDSLSWQQENLLTLIDSVNDSLVSMLLLKRSNIDTAQDALFFNLQRERTESVLTTLDKAVAEGQFNNWHYPAICLWCLLDWVDFRELAEWRSYTHLVQFFEQNSTRAILAKTDPRV